MKCRRFYLFVIDDQTGKLRLPIAPGRPKPQFAEIEFDPAESLCQYLVEQSCPLEVEVSPYNAKLSSILSSARDRLERLGAAVVFGLVRRGELNGLMTVGTKDSQEFYNWEDLALLKTVANQAAIAIENTGLFEDAAQGHEIKKEPAAASEVQRHLLPSLIPQLVTCQVAGRRAPARSVSGDYYDFFELAGRKIGMAMGDVSAKGLAASLLMANLQELLRTHAPATEDLSELVRRINHHVYGSSRGAKYCAFFYGVFDADHFSFDFVNAGHNPPLLLQTGKSRFLEATGIPLGLFADAAHEVRREALEPGARLLLYSDGITEARNSNGEFFGVDRLVRSLAGGDDLDAADIVERILVDVHHFSGNAPIEDDQTLVLLKLKTKRQ